MTRREVAGTSGWGSLRASWSGAGGYVCLFKVLLCTLVLANLIGRGSLSWGTDSSRLTWGRACGTFPWLPIHWEGPAHCGQFHLGARRPWEQASFAVFHHGSCLYCASACPDSPQWSLRWGVWAKKNPFLTAMKNSRTPRACLLFGVLESLFVLISGFTLCSLDLTYPTSQNRHEN